MKIIRMRISQLSVRFAIRGPPLKASASIREDRALGGISNFIKLSKNENQVVNTEYILNIYNIDS